MRNREISLKQDGKDIPLDKYAGEWVAFANGRVLAHEGTLDKLMRKVEKLKRKPSVFLVPKEEAYIV